MRLCAIIPTYRHVSALPRMTEAARAHCDAVFIIDDGNAQEAREAIARLHAPERAIMVLRHEHNQGKGKAVSTGFRAALAEGFTHALQIDADGQHDVADLPKFIEALHAAPEAMICGKAVFDQSVPKARKFGRYITKFWVNVETLSFDIADSMCGYRLYPLAAVDKVLKGGDVGARMDFDIEIAVRLHWNGVRAVNIPTRVIYPEGNVSNFEMLADNVRISLIHTRMVIEAPYRLLRKALGAA